MFGKTSFGCRAFVTAVILSMTEIASAQSADPALQRAQTLVDDAGALMDAGNYAEACPKLEEAAVLLPEGIGAKLALGECYVGLGRLASAWEQYSRAEVLAVATNDKRAAEARTEVKRLAPKLAGIKIVIPDWMYDLGGLSVKVDERKLDNSTWSSRIPIDTGAHIIKVAAPGLETWSRSIRVEKNGELITVAVPDLRASERLLRESPKPSVPAVLHPREQRERDTLVKTDSVSTTRNTGASTASKIGVFAISTGAAGLIVGATLGVHAWSTRDESNAEGACNAENNSCRTKLGVTLRDDALAFAKGSNVAFILGGLVAAGGIVLVAAAPRQKDDSPSKPRASVSLNVDVAPGWIGLRGAW